MLRIISWNCQGAFRNKLDNILELKPDILIVIECEPIEKLKFGKLLPVPNDCAWYSDNGKKGIGIFSFCDYKFELLSVHNAEFRYIIPFRVFNEISSFYLLAVWAMDNKANPLVSYIGQIWNAVNFYSSLFKENCIVIGDFNSNKIWDVKERLGNHSSVVEFLQAFNIVSLYHHYFAECQGEESFKTFYLHRNQTKPYHIDYVFASESFISEMSALQVGRYEHWIHLSDHVPIIADLSVPSRHVNYNCSYLDFVSQDIDSFSVVFKEKFHDEIEELKAKAIKTDSLEYDKSDLYLLLANFKKLESIYLEIL